jgi:DNA-binding NtrC family response regulator
MNTPTPFASPVELIGRDLCRDVMAGAAAGGPVLVLGEPGTGKAEVAHVLHDLGPCRGRPLVRVDCATGSAGTLAALLGAAAAVGGTVLADRVAGMPLAAQAPLLTIPHLIATADRELAVEVGRGRFRADVFYRLNARAVRVPPLRERADDLPTLARRALATAAVRAGRPAVELAPASLALLGRYDWPGNLRELESVMTLAVLLARDGVAEVPPAWLGLRAAVPSPPPRDGEQRGAILDALARAGGKVGKAARLLGWPRSSLYGRMCRLGLRTRPARG